MNGHRDHWEVSCSEPPRLINWVVALTNVSKDKAIVSAEKDNSDKKKVWWGICLFLTGDLREQDKILPVTVGKYSCPGG